MTWPQTIVALLVLLPGSLLFTCPADAGSDPFLHTFYYSADLTGDGQQENIELTITAPEKTAPFSWAVTIRQQETILFSHSRDDSAYDRFFREPGYYGQDDLGGKRKYYLEDLPAGLLRDQVVFDRDSLDEPFETKGTTLRQVFMGIIEQDLTERYRVPEHRRGPIATALLERLLNGGKTLNLPGSPQGNWASYAYSKDVGGFVLVYAP